MAGFQAPIDGWFSAPADSKVEAGWQDIVGDRIVQIV
jgi:hypothetical protein